MSDPNTDADDRGRSLALLYLINMMSIWSGPTKKGRWYPYIDKTASV